MDIDAVTILGLIAAFCTTIAFLPQVLKNWKRRSVGDLSFGTFGLLTLGILLWLIYGILIGNLPIIASNMVTLLLCGANLAQMIWFRIRPAA